MKPKSRITLLALGLVAATAWALPSAKDLLDDCRKSLEVDCKTQHLVTKTITVIKKTGESPVTMVQSLEMWKKKPDLLKTIIDNGITRQETIGKGDYLFIQDPITKKYSSIKSPFKIDPFQKMNQSISGFGEAVVADNGDGTLTVTLRGGTLPESMDRTEVLVDGEAKVVTRVLGFSKAGSEVLRVELEYAEVGGKKYVKRMVTGSDTGTYGLSSEMVTVVNEVDPVLEDAFFEVKK